VHATSVPAPDAPVATPPPAAAPAAADGNAEAQARGDLAAERALLSVARAALGRGDAASALAAVARHARQFPDGQLLEERESLEVRALAAHGERAAARAAAFAFERRHPDSLFLPAVRAVSDDDGDR
jgi:hypothetical protein